MLVTFLEAFAGCSSASSVGGLPVERISENH